MDPTPVATVRRRPGVGGASLTLAAVSLVLALALPTCTVRAARPDTPIDATASPTLPPGQEKKQTPVPAPTPAPAASAPAPATGAPAESATQAPAVSDPLAPSTLDPAPAPTAVPDPGATGGSATTDGPSGSAITDGSSGSATTNRAGGNTGPAADPGDEVPIPIPTVAPPLDDSPAPDRGEADGGPLDGRRSPVDPVADGPGLPIGLAYVAAGLIGCVALVVAWRRRLGAVPGAPPPAVIVDAPDHEQLLADALAPHAGRRVESGGRRPAWLRRLETGPPATAFNDPEPEPDDEDF